MAPWAALGENREGELLKRSIPLLVLLMVLAAGCAVQEKPVTHDGPFEIAVLATTDTRGEIEPCG